jgi:hypothetical protein
MKKLVIFCLVLFCISAFKATEFPEAEISNGIVKVNIYLPDSEIGYYRATRFDWSGVIKSLSYKGHSYFGEWFKKHDPSKHDAITGPVEEFDPIGYDEARVGEKFLKIGVGSLRKSNTKPYSSYGLYEIENHGKWGVKKRSDKIEISHELTDDFGYSYLYTKTISVVKGKPEMLLEHTLKNTGQRLIKGDVYNHNFFVMDNQQTGTDIKIKFPFEIQGSGKGLGQYAQVEDKEIKYLRNLKDNENVHIPILRGYGTEVKDNDFRIENHKSGAGVRILGDKPLSRMVFWSSSTTSCPEPYIHISINPGQKMRWTNTYQFYEIP